MKKILLVLSVSLILFAQEIEITSQKFEASENELISKFLGNVQVKRGKNRLWAEKLFVYFNKQKKPIKFVAIDNVRFDLFDQKNKEYKGKCKKLVYYPNKKVYQFFDNVHVVTYPDKKEVYGDKIYLDLIASKVNVAGTKKRPVKMILNIEEK
ncbi:MULTISPECIES: lipopolysaccharide transport periplasmic protein LptA [unclassified Nitratiruptor]|uniref:lipopolysaccharide transport periplasmic protein LptA n=1 Tax=unclassified Nitratiruptor TaxID=2624044 RepID=UPI0019168BED|nr:MULTISPECIES: lipopolysaccharide transport periplasmic protein LptA [unclassified Nitratiruptor]BCD60499.1 lipopolysaccharide export system protein LptA [Nitratiruptor sp. YY08-10]BCD64012.1 lipopolysaccharide export system protein LptA [Nitratiruptor sp. YY08-14]